jgi:hypothetical protein
MEEAMRSALSFLFVLTLSGSTAAAQDPMVPCGLPFECVTDVRVANATATWRMTFDRRWPGIYDIVHWEIAYTDGRRAEYLAELMRPEGERMYYRFFTRERRGVWYTFGIKKRMVWRDVHRHGPEQDVMVLRLRQVLGIAALLREGTDPAWVRF